MASKRINTLNILIVAAVIAAAYLIRSPWYPLRRETKISLGYPRDSLLNFTELTGAYGYISEEHIAVTEDGYIITLFRISKAKNCHQKKINPPVLLVHGLMMSSDSWIDSGPDAGLAYMIADTCFDLWVGNVRGNYYSRKHIHLNPDKDPEYWKFYIDEIGRFDVPAMIDYILDYTEVEKLNYIGFSQGASVAFVMCSERPEYCNKVNLIIGLAPASRQFNTQSGLFRGITQGMEKMQGLLTSFGVYEAIPKGGFVQEFVSLFCPQTQLTEKICELFMYHFDNVDSYHYGTYTNETIRTLFGHYPAGTSVKNMARYGQSVKSKRFEKYNYGKENNLIVYGSEVPPKYNLSAALVPFLCIYGENDGLVDTKDVKWLVKQLPNVVESYKVKDPLWSHFDFTYSRDLRDSVFPKVHEYLLKYTST